MGGREAGREYVGGREGGGREYMYVGGRRETKVRWIDR